MVKEQIKNEQLLEVLNNMIKVIENDDEIKSQDSLKFITEKELEYLIENYRQNDYTVIPVIKDQHLQNKLEEIDHVIDYGMSLNELINKAKNIQILDDKLEEHALITNVKNGWYLMFKDSYINNKSNMEFDILKNVIDNFVRKGYRCEFYDKDWSLI